MNLRSPDYVTSGFIISETRHNSKQQWTQQRENESPGVLGNLVISVVLGYFEERQNVVVTPAWKKCQIKIIHRKSLNGIIDTVTNRIMWSIRQRANFHLHCLQLDRYRDDSDTVIIRMMWPVSLDPKVITLSCFLLFEENKNSSLEIYQVKNRLLDI